MQENFRKRLVVLGIVLTLFIVGLVVFNFVSTGSVTVTAGGEDSVSIARINNGRVDQASLKQAKHSLHTRLKAGNYKISAFNHTNATSQVIEVKSRETKDYDLQLETLRDVEAVLGQGVSNLFADSTTMSFVDDATGQLARIEIDNHLNPLDIQQTFSEIYWLSASSAVAKGGDRNLYLIDGSSLRNIDLPASIAQSDYSFAVGPDGTIYVGSGGSLYEGSVSGGFKKIYSDDDSIAALSASKDKVALIYSANDHEGVQANDSRLVIVSSTGKKTADLSETNIFTPRWSKDGRHLIVKNDYGGLLFNESLGERVNIPVDGIGDIAWLNNQELVYSNKDTLWKYDLSNAAAQQVSNSAGGTITNVYPDVTDSYVYLQYEKPDITDTSSVNVVGRIGLKKQSPKSAAVSIGLFLPASAGDCNLSYLNFSRLSLLVYLPTGADQAQCQSQAKDLLDSYSIKPGSYDLQVLPQPASD